MPFWELVDLATGGLPLDSMLHGRTRSEIMRFRLVLGQLSDALCERATQRVGRDPGGTGWMEVSGGLEYVSEKLARVYFERSKKSS